MGTKKNNNNNVTMDGGILWALKVAHESNNAKAISEDFALGSGVTPENYRKWVDTIDSLHSRVEPWVEMFNDKDATEEDLQKLYAEIFPTYRRLINQTGEKIFVRESDAVRICEFAHKHGKSAKGSIDVVKGKVSFRKEVETMFGIRLAQSAALKEDDYKVITRYEGAQEAIKNADRQLDGYEKNGKKVPGLREDLTKAVEELDAARAGFEQLKQLGVSKGLKETDFDETIITQPHFDKIKALEAAIKNVEGKKTKAKDRIKDLEKDYLKLMVKIGEIK